MGQSWRFYDLDSRTILDDYLWLGEFFFRRGADIHGLLCRVPFPRTQLQFKELPAGSTPSDEFSPRSLNALPVELIDLLFGFLVDRLDILCFAFVSRKCYSVGERYIFSFIDKWANMSAGHRIIVLGDSSAADDLPPDIQLTDTEKTALSMTQIELYGTDAYPNRLISLDDYAASTFACRPFYERCEGLRNFLIRRLNERYDRLYARSWSCTWLEWLEFNTKMIERVMPDQYALPGDVRVLVLRNLSRRLFVLGTAVDSLNRDLVLGPDVDEDTVVYDLCFGDVVLVRICWSSYNQIHMQDDTDKIHRGVWAGDRFDIVHAGVFERERDAEAMQGLPPWLDVSDEVLAEVETAWVSNDYVVRKAEVVLQDAGNDSADDANDGTASDGGGDEDKGDRKDGADGASEL